MNSRKVIAGIVGILTFIGVLLLIGSIITSIWPDYSPSEHPLERLGILFVSFITSSSIYNMIKGEEPEFEEKNSSDEISKKLKEKRDKQEIKVWDAPPKESNVTNLKIDNKETKLSNNSELSKENSNYEVPKPQIKLNNPKVAEVGHIKSSSNESKSKVVNASATNQYKYCGECGDFNDNNAKYCAGCGSKFGLIYASIALRTLAFLIDGVILFVISFGLLIAATIVFYDFSEDFIFLLWAILSLITFIVYFIALEGPLTNGQTFGKMATSIRIVDEESKKSISYTQSLIRNILRILDIMPYFIPYLVGFIAAWASKKNQRIGDIAARTIVIKEK